MGMYLVGRRLSMDEYHAVLADPTTVSVLLWGNAPDDETDLPEAELDLQKAWHGLHYLLTGTAWETRDGAGAAILGGEEIGEDGDYGPARLLRPEAVHAVAAGLDALDVAALRARYDPQTFMAQDIYPSIWDEADVFETFLAPCFIELRDFYRAAAANHQAVLLAIT
jgi:hypothetical protein